MNTHLIYRPNDPGTTVEVYHDPDKVASYVKGVKTPVFVVPVAKAEDLRGLPLKVLTALHEKAGGEEKLPRKRDDAETVVWGEIRPPRKRARGGVRTRTRRAKTGVGDRARQLILEGKTRDKVLNQIHAEFPESRMTKRGYYNQRSKLRREGLIE